MSQNMQGVEEVSVVNLSEIAIDWAVKAVDSTSDATVYCDSSDGGTGY